MVRAIYAYSSSVRKLSGYFCDTQTKYNVRHAKGSRMRLAVSDYVTGTMIKRPHMNIYFLLIELRSKVMHTLLYSGRSVYMLSYVYNDKSVSSVGDNFDQTVSIRVSDVGPILFSHK